MNIKEKTKHVGVIKILGAYSSYQGFHHQRIEKAILLSYEILWNAEYPKFPKMTALLQDPGYLAFLQKDGDITPCKIASSGFL